MTLQTLFCRKRAAFLLSLAFHGLLLGGIIYFSMQEETPQEEPKEEPKALQMVSYRLQTPPPPQPIKKTEPPKPQPVKKIEPKPKPKPKPKKIEPKLTVPLKEVKKVEEPKVVEEPQVVEAPQPQVVEAPTPPPPPQKTPQEIVKEQEQEYAEVNFSVLRDMATQNLVYPRVAKKMGWSGIVEIKLVVGTDGKLIEAKVHKSSGRELLDNSALKTVLMLKNKPLPKPKTRSEIILPIAFRMK